MRADDIRKTLKLLESTEVSTTENVEQLDELVLDLSRQGMAKMKANHEDTDLARRKGTIAAMNATPGETAEELCPYGGRDGDLRDIWIAAFDKVDQETSAIMPTHEDVDVMMTEASTMSRLASMYGAVSEDTRNAHSMEVRDASGKCLKSFGSPSQMEAYSQAMHYIQQLVDSGEGSPEDYVVAPQGYEVAPPGVTIHEEEPENDTENYEADHPYNVGFRDGYAGKPRNNPWHSVTDEYEFANYDRGHNDGFIEYKTTQQRLGNIVEGVCLKENLAYYSQGMKARMDGYSAEDNPYDERGEQDKWDAFNLGFRDGGTKIKEDGLVDDLAEGPGAANNHFSVLTSHGYQKGKSYPRMGQTGPITSFAHSSGHTIDREVERDGSVRFWSSNPGMRQSSMFNSLKDAIRHGAAYNNVEPDDVAPDEMSEDFSMDDDQHDAAFMAAVEKEVKAYNDGHSIGEAGLRNRENPHPKNSPAAYAWSEGVSDGYAHYQRNEVLEDDQVDEMFGKERHSGHIDGIAPFMDFEMHRNGRDSHDYYWHKDLGNNVEARLYGNQRGAVGFGKFTVDVYLVQDPEGEANVVGHKKVNSFASDVEKAIADMSSKMSGAKNPSMVDKAKDMVGGAMAKVGDMAAKGAAQVAENGPNDGFPEAPPVPQDQIAAFDKHKFCQEVGEVVEQMYGYEDGSDLCFNLLDYEMIKPDMTIDHAAQIVAQHIEQA